MVRKLSPIAAEIVARHLPGGCFRTFWTEWDGESGVRRYFIDTVDRRSAEIPRDEAFHLEFEMRETPA